MELNVYENSNQTFSAFIDKSMWEIICWIRGSLSFCLKSSDFADQKKNKKKIKLMFFMNLIKFPPTKGFELKPG